MSTREMICSLIHEKVPNSDLDLLYQLVLKFIPADEPTPHELHSHFVQQHTEIGAKWSI